MQQNDLTRLIDRINQWYVGGENPTATDIGNMTFDLVRAYGDGNRSTDDFDAFTHAFITLALFVLDKSPKAIGVCGAVAHKLEFISDMVQEKLPDSYKNVQNMITLLRKYDLELLHNMPANGKITALRRVDTDEYMADGDVKGSSDFELVELGANEINKDGTVEVRKIEHHYNHESANQSNSNPLEVLRADVRSGNYDKSPVAIGNLTLKIGRMLDENPTDENTIIAIDILNDMFGNADENTKYIIIEAITHKLDYINHKYGYLLPQSFQEVTANYIAELRDLFVSHCELAADGKVQTLRLVSHSTMHYDFDGLLDAVSINESKNFYEVISVTAEDLRADGSVPAREVVFEDKPQRQSNDNDNNNGGGGGGGKPSSDGGHGNDNGGGQPPLVAGGNMPPSPPSPPSPGAGGGGDNNNGGGNNPPPFAFGMTPPPPPPHRVQAAPPRPPRDDMPVRQVDINYNGRKVDVLDLILMAVLDSLFDSVEPFQDGAKFKLKPEVLRHSFPPYSFTYAGKQYGPGVSEDAYGINIDDQHFNWSVLNQYFKEISLKSGRKAYVTHTGNKNTDIYTVNIDVLDSDPIMETRNIMVGDTNDMPAIIYACKFLEYAGAAPQITPEGEIYVADADKLYINDHVNLMQIKNDMTRLTEFIRLRSQPLRRKALDAFALAWPKKGHYIPAELRPYTTSVANQFWKTPPKIMVNGRELDMSSVFSSGYGK